MSSDFREYFFRCPVPTSCSLKGQSARYRGIAASLLSRPIHSAEKATQVPRHRNDNNCYGFNWQAIPRQYSFFSLSGSHVDKPNDPDQEARDASHHEMHQEYASKFLSLELPLPRENPRNDHRHGRDRCDQQVVICRGHQHALALPLPRKSKTTPMMNSAIGK
jgi:hypothetical protein